MAGSYVALGEAQTQEATSSLQKGRSVALFSFFVGFVGAMAWVGTAGQPALDQEAVNMIGYQQQLRGSAMPTRIATLAYSPQMRALPWQFTRTMEKALQQHRGSAYPFRNLRVSAEGVTGEIMEKIKTLTLLEAAELVKMMEEEFGIDTSAVGAPMMMAAPGAAGGGGAAAEEEKSTFDVVLEAVDDSKRVAALKVVRGITGLGLKETKDFMGSLPKAVKEGIPKEDAEATKKELEAAGCKATIK